MRMYVCTSRMLVGGRRPVVVCVYVYMRMYVYMYVCTSRMP